VREADGAPLPGHRVALQIRGPARWRTVGAATSDGNGVVAVATPPARATTGYRFRAANGVHSTPWKVVTVPTLSASAGPAGADESIAATARGGHPGDRVVLLRRAAGRLVKIGHGTLDANGSVTFAVPLRRRPATYVVRLLGTARHAPAQTRVDVPGTG
jgi:hypothetical protein